MQGLAPPSPAVEFPCPERASAPTSLDVAPCLWRTSQVLEAHLGDKRPRSPVHLESFSGRLLDNRCFVPSCRSGILPALGRRPNAHLGQQATAASKQLQLATGEHLSSPLRLATASKQSPLRPATASKLMASLLALELFQWQRHGCKLFRAPLSVHTLLP